MSLLKRLLSSDYRAAVAAEAAGDLELAAERYALAGELAAAVRVHLARAARADTRAAEIAALRDALHWAADDAAQRAEVCARLGRALLAQARDQGVATDRDRERVREAAALLVDAGAYEEAGDALESIGDDAAAARAFEAGGLVERMEHALARDAARERRARALADAFGEYEVHMAGGDRTAARDALRRCVEIAEDKAAYRQLLDDLDARVITGGRVELRRRGAPRMVLAARREVTLGRDALCDVVLRSGGISRTHAAIAVEGDGASRTFVLRDLGSRNGTRIGDLPIAGAVPLAGAGAFSLGDDCTLEFEVRGDPPLLAVEVVSGIDRGVALVAGADGDELPVPSVPAVVQFSGGSPRLRTVPSGTPLRLNDRAVALGSVELIHRDALSIAGIELEVL